MLVALYFGSIPFPFNDGTIEMTDSILKDEERRRQILDATITSIALSGLANVTLQTIAQTAGLSKGGLTHYYSSKQQLFKDAFTYFFERVVAECKSHSQLYENHTDKLLSFDIIFRMDHPLIQVAHPVLHDFMSVAVHDQQYKEIFHSWVETWVALLVEILEDGVAKGCFSCGNLDYIARTLSAVIQGIATRSFLASANHSTDWAVSAYRDLTLHLVGASKLS